MTPLGSLLLGVTAALVVAAAVRLRIRLGEPLRRPAVLDDEAIRAIESTGRVEIDDELDPTAIEDEERKFWEEEEWE